MPNNFLTNITKLTENTLVHEKEANQPHVDLLKDVLWLYRRLSGLDSQFFQNIVEGNLSIEDNVNLWTGRNDESEIDNSVFSYSNGRMVLYGCPTYNASDPAHDTGYSVEQTVVIPSVLNGQQLIFAVSCQAESGQSADVVLEIGSVSSSTTTTISQASAFGSNPDNNGYYTLFALGQFDEDTGSALLRIQNNSTHDVYINKVFAGACLSDTYTNDNFSIDDLYDFTNDCGLGSAAYKHIIRDDAINYVANPTLSIPTVASGDDPLYYNIDRGTLSSAEFGIETMTSPVLDNAITTDALWVNVAGAAGASPSIYQTLTMDNQKAFVGKTLTAGVWLYKAATTTGTLTLKLITSSSSAADSSDSDVFEVSKKISLSTIPLGRWVAYFTEPLFVQALDADNEGITVILDFSNVTNADLYINGLSVTPGGHKNVSFSTRKPGMVLADKDDTQAGFLEQKILIEKFEKTNFEDIVVGASGEETIFEETITTHGRPIEVAFHAIARMSEGTRKAFFLYVDDVVVFRTRVAGPASGRLPRICDFTYVLDNLAAGSHTIKVTFNAYINNSGGNCAICGDLSTNGVSMCSNYHYNDTIPNVRYDAIPTLIISEIPSREF